MNANEPVRDLTTLLASLTLSRRTGEFCIATVPPTTTLDDDVEALIREDEGVTAVCTKERADAEGWEYEFPCAWLTMDVYSALDAVGLTTAVTEALAENDIPCNVIAARNHDHLLVPCERAEEAVAVLSIPSPCVDPRAAKLTGHPRRT